MLLKPSFWVVVFSFFTAPVFANQWIFFQNHLHSTDDHSYSRFPESTPSFESYSAEGIQTLVQMAKEAGIQALVKPLCRVIPEGLWKGMTIRI
ncbi:MAG: hypothetical protein HYY62_04795 [Deltaproteobacteria bacterium]|nr:hypothetical protein [Deltaproteobacteria bacterium]